MIATSTSFREIFSRRLCKSEINDLVIISSSYKKPFDELVDLIINGTRHEAFMAAWTMQYAAVKKPEWFYEHLDKLLISLEEKPNESVLRSVARVIWKTPIPPEKYGIVTQKCVEWLENKDSSIAVKAFSFHILSKIIEVEPGLSSELRDIAESILPFASTGLANAAHKLLKKIQLMGY